MENQEGINKTNDIHILTEEEKKLIVQLRERVKNELPPSFHCKSDEDQDLFLVRWLRARDLHLDNATKMLSNSLKWRQEKQADEILTIRKLDKFYEENFPFHYAGGDKHNHPILLCPMASWDFRKIVNNADRLAEFDDFVTHMFETYMAKISDHHRSSKDSGGGPVTQIFFIMDVKSYPYMQLMNIGAIKKLIQVASTYEAHYPEILYRMVFINCSSYFSILINIVRPFLAPKTMGKVTTYSYSQMKDWEKDMIEELDPSIIPKQYGGTAEDIK